MAEPSLGLLWLDGRLRAELAHAITLHLRWARQNAVPVSVELRELLDTLAASKGQERPSSRDEAAITDGLLVGYPQAAQALGVSVRSLRRRVAAGQVQPVPWGRRRLFLVDELRELAKEGVA